MIRLEKCKQIDRIDDENEKKRLINEVKASSSVIKLIKQILDEKIDHIESQYESNLSDPYLLSASVKTVSELKKLTNLFEETHNDQSK